MSVNFVEAEEEKIRGAHERLKREHAVLVEIFELSADGLSDQTARSANLARVREHLARLRVHRAVLRTV